MAETPEDFDTGLTRAELDPERPRPIETPWGTMALFVIGQRVLCVQAFCPHLLGPLFQGTVSGGAVTCPWHAWRFDLESGERIDAAKPAWGRDARPLERCEVGLGAAGTLVLRRPRRGPR